MRRTFSARRRGKVVVLFALMLPIFLGLGAFAVDIGRISLTQSKLQAAADAAAIAAVEELPDLRSVRRAVKKVSRFNLGLTKNILKNADIKFGTWDGDNQTFTKTSIFEANAVRVTAQLSDARGNALTHFFGGFVGVSDSDVIATAIAMRETPTPQGGTGTRFLIDDEMIDKDVPAIEDLADDLNRDVEELVTPRGFNAGKQYGAGNWTWEDNFLDLPAGAQLSLPTGQGTDYDNNDAGMFDIEHPEFPFTSPTAFRDFVMYSETGGDTSKWGTDKEYIYDQLDPLRGVAPVTDDNQYAGFVDPDFVHISPVTFSDTSTLNMDGDVPQTNAKGLRRGLIAFKIIAVGQDVDGGGSVLPELVIEIVDPSTVSLDDIQPASQSSSGGDGTIQLVQ